MHSSRYNPGSCQKTLSKPVPLVRLLSGGLPFSAACTASVFSATTIRNGTDAGVEDMRWQKPANEGVFHRTRATNPLTRAKQINRRGKGLEQFAAQSGAKENE